MKKNIIINGLISGAIVTTIMVISMWYCYTSVNLGSSMVIGFGSMILAFSLIIVAVKNQRDKLNEGVISFGQAFLVGLYVSLIASTMYVIGWSIEFHYFMPDFLERFSEMQLKELATQNLSPAEHEEAVAKMNEGNALYSSPLSFVLITYTEILPVGVLMSLIVAAVMKRKATKEGT